MGHNNRVDNRTWYSALKSIFHWIGKIYRLIIFIIKMKSRARLIVHKRRQQAELRREIIFLNHRGKSVKIQQQQVLELENEILKITKSLAKVVI